MSENSPTLIVEFPTEDKGLLHWWHVENGSMRAKGCDDDPLSVSGISTDAEDFTVGSCIALMPSAAAAVHWHEVADGITERQAMAAASIATRENGLDAQGLHISAAMDSSGEAVAVAVKTDIMGSGLKRLQKRNLDPDVIVPAGWLVPVNTDSVTSADFGFEVLLRSDRMIAPDEPSLRTHLTGGKEISPLAEAALDQLLIQASENSALNLRSGIFAKKTSAAMTGAQKRLLFWLAAALLILSLTIPLARLARYHWAADAEDVAASEKAISVLGKVVDLATAEQQLDKRLVSQNRGNIVFSVPASALFSVVQQTPGVSIERLSYRNDGVVSAGLTAVRNEDINPALVALQNAGFLVTAAPRTDATGSAKADITVRAP